LVAEGMEEQAALGQKTELTALKYQKREKKK
jgi:hypothetical protein